MGEYCRSIWRCRYFWLSLVKMDLRSRYRGSILGMGWSLLNPIAMTAIFTVVFCGLWGESPATFAPRVMIGLACWNFITSVVFLGCQSFFQGESYIRQYPAPMAIYPLRTVLSNAFHFGLALLVAIFLAFWNIGIIQPLALVGILPALLLMLLFGWALATLAAIATVYFRDTRHLTEIVFSAAFYLTPIFYREEVLAGRGLGLLLHLNPFLPFINLLRLPLVGSEIGPYPPLSTWIKAIAVTCLAVSFAVYLLRRQEKRLIFQL